MNAIILAVGLAFLSAANALAAPAAKANEPQTSSALRISVRPDGPVNPGQTVEVTVDGPKRGPVDAMLVSGGDPKGFDVKELPFTARITIPREAVGSFGLIVTMAATPGASLLGPGSVSSEKTLSVKVPAALQQLDVLPAHVRFMKPGVNGALVVYGHYADGVRRKVESRSAGTTYASSDPRVVSVSPEDGRLRSEGFGTAVVTVANNGSIVRIPVEVRAEPPVPHR